MLFGVWWNPFSWGQDLLDGIVSFFYGILLSIDCIIYSFVSYVYQIFLVLAQGGEIIDAKFIGDLINRIYIILGVAMLFILAYSLLKAMVNPDEWSKGKNSPIKLVKNVIISVVLIALLPTIFDFAFSLQNSLLMNNTIGKIIVGVHGENDAESTIRNGGYKMAATVFGAFFHASTEVNENGKMYCNTKAEEESGVNEAGESCEPIVVDNDGTTFGDLWVEAEESTTFWALARSGPSIIEGKISYYIIIAPAAGIFVLFVLLSYCLDMALRLVKLAVFEVIAPIPILAKIVPNEQAGKVFDNWLKATISTFIEVFIRIAILYFAVFIITTVTASINNIFSPLVSGSARIDILLLAQALIIIGIIMFVKQAPQIIKDITGLDSGKYGKSLMKGIGMMTSTIGGGTTAAIRKTVSDLKEHPEYNKRQRVSRTISALGGGMRRGLWHGSKVDKFGDIPKMAGKTASNTLAHQGRVEVAGGNVKYYKQKGKDIETNVRNWLSGSFEAQQKELDLVNEFLKDAKAVKSTTEGLVRDKKYLFNMVGRGQAAKNYQTADGETIILDENTSLSAVDSIIQSLKATGKVADAKLADEINNEMQQRIKKIGQAMATASVDRSQVPRFNNNYMMEGKNIEEEAMPTLATASSQYTIIQQRYKQNPSLDAVINFQTDENGNHRDLQPDNVSKLADSLETQAAKISQNIKIEQERRKANSGGKKS